MKKILILMLVSHFGLSFAGEMKEGFRFQPDTIDDLVERYRKSGATSFENFHHEYLMMLQNGFPNLKLETDKAKKTGLTKADLMNPQNLLLNDEVVYQATESQKKQNPAFAKAVYTQEAIMELGGMPTSLMLDEGAYKKNGYYRYFKDYFAKSGPDSTIAPCVHLDFRGASNTYNGVEFKGVDGSLKARLYEVFEPLLGEEEIRKLVNGRLRNCLGLKFNEAQLDYLYAHEKVYSFYPLETFLLDYRSPIKGR